ncbi:alpha/beta fold hydrolase [Paenibacillus shenyangensis]|uniref:alpha/beta fold hydrolase n=1 Tax=Paenibacillus sp. A9 TaxID=1284352 RepID=UPI00036D1F0A|nr:alpha/beta hydrolase [Paenibacillus sp. A9]
MRKKLFAGFIGCTMLFGSLVAGCSTDQLSTTNSNAASSESKNAALPAESVIGEDYVFPNKIEGMPATLSDFKDLKIGSFETSDGVELSYWAAGKGEPLILLPGYSLNGAHFLNVMYLLSDNYRVYTLDPRNQGLSEDVKYGNRLSRHATDLMEFTEYLGIKSADFVGHSMGAATLWSYIDLYGTESIKKVVFVDQPPIITPRFGMTDREIQNMGVPFASIEQLEEAMLALDFSTMESLSTPYYENTWTLSNEFAKNNKDYLNRIIYDHGTNDWRDVIQNKIDVPVAIFSGELSPNLKGQQWIHSVIPGSTLYVYSKEEFGDHSLMEKNPVKFAEDLQNFLK